MRVDTWNPDKFDDEIEKTVVDRLVMGAEHVRDRARSQCPVGTISRPMYKKGKYANQPWTARDNGRLRASIRVVRKRTKSGALSRSKRAQRNVRVYIGNYLAYYGPIVEYDRKILRSALWNSVTYLRQMTGAK